MARFSLGPRLSDWFIAVYLTITLALRFLLEPQLQGYYLVSLALGAFALLFLWALIKSKVLQPTYFGFFPQETKEN
ncbi:hypothetical protein [Lewinella sp. LCG006]|uniref:hypothetical protein n=1 Tax=Lewinella sp. LCG006 TaxID=3231911 RepID=UPI00345F590C